MANIRISDELYARIAALAGERTAKAGRSVSIQNTAQEVIDLGLNKIKFAYEDLGGWEINLNADPHEAGVFWLTAIYEDQQLVLQFNHAGKVLFEHSGAIEPIGDFKAK